MRKPNHNHRCSEHVVMRHGPNGGPPTYRCNVCKTVLKLRLKPEQVLARIPA